MVDDLEQTKVSIENNIKMLALAERQSKKLLEQETNIVNSRNVKAISRQEWKLHKT